MYRILSPTAILGYGFPESSFEKAMELDIDLIAVDAGSMDAGPYYLGSGSHYVGRSALERDLGIMVKGALFQKCPLIIGSAGFSGASPQIDEIVRIVKKIIETESSETTKIAIIKSDISYDQLEPVLEALTPLGEMPPLDKSLVSKSKMVGQMGVEPIIKALESSAQFVICGRSYDPAVFAADPIRKGYPIAACYHAAKILECGAIACEPGSGSDCLIAELHEDGKAVFYPTNEKRSATIKSIAAHTLYEKSRPDVFYMPGGVLSIQNTSFFKIDDRTAGFEGSEFKKSPYSIKIEGGASLGERIASIVPLRSVEGVSDNVRVYGRNAVEEFEVADPINETGILVTVKGKKKGDTQDALSFIRSTMLHYGYAGRLSTAGNLAFPFSPSDITITGGNGNYVSLFIAGTRDPVFQTEWGDIKDTVISSLKDQHRDLFNNCEFEFLIADKENPMAIMESIGSNLEIAKKTDTEALKMLSENVDDKKQAFQGIRMGNCYTWSLYHLTHDEDMIGSLFDVNLEEFSNGLWERLPTEKPSYDFTDSCENDNVKIDLNRNQVNTNTLPTSSAESVLLTDVAKVIRSKNAGINELTYDILFKTNQAYQKALTSGVFSIGNLSKVFRVTEKKIIGCYKYDPALAIKFTLHRSGLSGGSGERDVFGAQQHSRLLNLRVPG